MTTPTHMSLDDEQKINETIARWIGWTRLHIAQLNRDHPNDRNDWLHGNPPGSEGCDAESEVPDYTRDLNAVALAEAKLSDEERVRFAWMLGEIVLSNSDNPPLPMSEFRHGGWAGMQEIGLVVSASAVDRIRALVAVLENTNGQPQGEEKIP